jgi:hypothetical protein
MNLLYANSKSKNNLRISRAKDSFVSNYAQSSPCIYYYDISRFIYSTDENLRHFLFMMSFHEAF